MGGLGSGARSAAERERAAEAEARHGPLIADAYDAYQAAACRLDDAIREALEAGSGVVWTADQVAVSPNALQGIRRRGRPGRWGMPATAPSVDTEIRRRGRPERWGMPMPGRGGPGPRRQRPDSPSDHTAAQT